MKNIIILITTIFVIAFLWTGFQSSAQEETKDKKEGYRFTIDKKLPATPVKNEYCSSTCWDFSTRSFLESEMLRIGKGEAAAESSSDQRQLAVGGRVMQQRKQQRAAAVGGWRFAVCG